MGEEKRTGWTEKWGVKMVKSGKGWRRVERGGREWKRVEERETVRVEYRCGGGEREERDRLLNS